MHLTAWVITLGSVVQHFHISISVLAAIKRAVYRQGGGANYLHSLQMTTCTGFRTSQQSGVCDHKVKWSVSSHNCEEKRTSWWIFRILKVVVHVSVPWASDFRFLLFFKKIPISWIRLVSVMFSTCEDLATSITSEGARSRQPGRAAAQTCRHKWHKVPRFLKGEKTNPWAWIRSPPPSCESFTWNLNYTPV